jgi:hypothetical protein
MIRRPLLALTLGVLLTGVFVPVAAAAAPDRETFPIDFEFVAPAGELCDFDYRQAATGQDVVTFFSDGRVQVQESVDVTHTNLDTDYTLTEQDRVFFQFEEDSENDVGVFWHLRDATGKIVLVQAGQIHFDEDGITHTPNLNPDFADVICHALGGNPAP